MRATYLIFGVLLMTLVISGAGIMISDLTSSYGVTHNETNFEVYDKLDNTAQLATNISGKIQDQTTNTGIVDLVGQFIGRAVDSLKLTFSALTSAQAMTNQASDDIGLPTQFKTAISLMLIIFLVLGVIVSAMIKKDV